MKVIINVKEKFLDENSISLTELLKRNNVQNPEMISVQVNGTFVKKDEFATTVIRDNDVIDYIYFMGGGQFTPGFSTKVIHAPYLKKDVHNALLMPIYSNAAYEFDTAEDMAEAFLGHKPAHMYSRISNPTVENFEQKIKNITGALTVTALSSGMAAIANSILTFTEQGDNLITSHHLFGNTYSLFSSTLRDLGVECRFIDLTRPDEILQSIDQKTRAVFFETITNPQLEVADIQILSEIARAHNLVLIADTTLTPPNIFTAKHYGIDLEVVSATKIISGGATSVGGLIIDYGTFDWSQIPKLRNYYKQYGYFSFNAKLRKEVFRNLGACLSPYHAYLQSIGLETLSLRFEKASLNSYILADFLSRQKAVHSVTYPGLAGSAFYEISKKQFNTPYPCSMLTFCLESKQECFRFINNLKLIRRATNISDNKTLVLHPASTIFSEYSEEKRDELGVSDTLIRITTGIEDPDDLLQDLINALNQ